MRGRHWKVGFLMLVGLMLSVVAMWGASAVIGSVAGSTNATVGGQALVANTTLFSGDSLRVSDGAAVVAMGMGSRMVFGRDTVASFERGPEGVTVVLGGGSVSMYHPEQGVGLRVKVGDLSVTPGKGFKTLGEVAMINGSLIVTAKEGTLRVEGTGRTMELTKGKTIAIMPTAAGAPQGKAASTGAHWSQTQVVNVVTLAAAGVGLGFSIANFQKTKDVQNTATKADADALAADADAKAATSTAAAAAAVAEAACKLVSPTDPACTPQ